MLLLIGAFLVSLIPCLGMFFWLRNGLLKDSPDYEGHKRRCDTAIRYGMLSVVFVVLGSALTHILGAIVGLRNLGLVWQAYYAFIVLAGVEEAVKFYMLKKTFGKYPDHAFSWIEIIIYMMCVAAGFEILESIEYAIGSGPGPMFMRGFTIMHVMFGFFMGYFCGKALKTGNKAYYVLAFVCPWLYHGLFDFLVGSDLINKNEALGLLALGMAVACGIAAIWSIFFFRKARKNETYTTPVLLPTVVAEAADADAASVDVNDAPADVDAAPSAGMHF